MMRAFPGFPDRAATTRIPTLWLRAVLADAESLAELKVTLHALRLLDAKRDYPRYVRTSELRADPATVASLQATGGLSSEDALAEGVRLAAARGRRAAPGARAARAAGGAAGAPPDDLRAVRAERGPAHAAARGGAARGGGDLPAGVAGGGVPRGRGLQ